MSTADKLVEMLETETPKPKQTKKGKNEMNKEQFKKTKAKHRLEIKKLRTEIKKHKMLIKQAKLTYKITKM